MPRVRTAQVNFTQGELAPQVGARIDLKQYYGSVRMARNVVTFPQGGFRAAPGRVVVDALDDAAGGARLIPFAFNTEQDYLLVLTANRLRVYRDDAVVADIATPWDATVVAEMDYAQSADTLIAVHQSMAPQRLMRGATHADWTIGAMPMSRLPTYDYGAVTPTGTVTPSAEEDTVTLTATSPVFTAAMVNGWEFKGNGGIARITEYTSATSVKGKTRVAFSDTDAIPADDWHLEEPVISTTRGWPGAVTFHEGRLWLGRMARRPSSIFGSVVGDFFNFDLGDALDDQGIDAAIDSDQVNAVMAIASGSDLLVWTTGALYMALRGGSPALTPKTFALAEQTRRGLAPSKPPKPVEIDRGWIFAERGGRTLHEAVYQEVAQAYTTSPLSLLAQHLVRDPVRLAVRKTSRDDDTDYVLCVNTDGTVAVINTLRDQQVTGWTLVEPAGQVLDIAVVDGTIYWLIRRVIAGTTRYLIERWDQAVRLDGAAVATGDGITNVTGLDWLEGATVMIIADGSLQPSQVVAGGAVTLARPADRVEVGLWAVPLVQTHPLEPSLPDGPAMGRLSRLVRVMLRTVEVQNVTVAGEPVKARRFGIGAGSPLDRAPPVLAGDILVDGFSGWDRQTVVTITQTAPGPFEVIGLVAEVQI